MLLSPARAGTGIIFRRVDKPGSPEIPARVEYVQDTTRSTQIGVGDIRVTTIEHVLAALRAYEIDNVYVDITAEEPPVGNGSAQQFVEIIEKSGIVEEEALTGVVSLQKPVYLSQGDIHLIALPDSQYRISYTLSYPQSAVLRAQYFSTLIDAEHFKKEIAPCRTFCRYEELIALMERGLIRGGSLENAVVIKDDVVISKEGLVFPDEMARHKILDLMGDMSLIGIQFKAHIIAIRSGHTSNIAFAKMLYQQLTKTEK